eukprot:5646121-Amphidinium_carterae.1
MVLWDFVPAALDSRFHLERFAFGVPYRLLLVTTHRHSVQDQSLRLQVFRATQGLDKGHGGLLCAAL